MLPKFHVFSCFCVKSFFLVGQMQIQNIMHFNNLNITET